MAYQDKATPEELATLADFNKNLPAIQDFRRRYPKEDLEGAYFKVTGKKWPEGRSVKLENGKGEITGDRTAKSVLGRYVAPIGVAAAMAIPGVREVVLSQLTSGGGFFTGGVKGATALGTAGKGATALTMGGNLLSKFSQGKTEARQNEVNNRLTYDGLAMDANSRANRQRMIADSSLNHQQSPAFSAFGKTYDVPHYGPQPTMESRAGDEEMRRQAMLQMMEGRDKPALTPYGQLPTTPGAAERATGWAGTGLNFLDLFNGIRRPNPYNSSGVDEEP